MVRVVTVTVHGGVALVLHLEGAAIRACVARCDVLISLVPAMKVCTQRCVRPLVCILLLLRHAGLVSRAACSSDLLVRIVLLARVEGCRAFPLLELAGGPVNG